MQFAIIILSIARNHIAEDGRCKPKLVEGLLYFLNYCLLNDSFCCDFFNKCFELVYCTELDIVKFSTLSFVGKIPGFSHTKTQNKEKPSLTKLKNNIFKFSIAINYVFHVVSGDRFCAIFMRHKLLARILLPSE